MATGGCWGGCSPPARSSPSASRDAVWGAGLARYLTARGVEVRDVNRPNRQERRRTGKDDPLDAEAAARTVLAGKTQVVPKAGDGPIEALRQLRIALRRHQGTHGGSEPAPQPVRHSA